jgi:hypothetical protein
MNPVNEVSLAPSPGAWKEAFSPPFAVGLKGDCRKMTYQIAPGELRSSERLGQEAQTGAQAKQGQRRAGIVRHQGATTGASSNDVTVVATQRTDDKGEQDSMSFDRNRLSITLLRVLRNRSDTPYAFPSATGG